MTRRSFSAALAGLAAAPLAAKTTGHRLIAQDKGHVAILDQAGKVEWSWENGATAHDLHLLPDGNLLAPTGRGSLAEVTPKKKVVWQWTSKPAAPYGGNVEIHGFQRLANGRTMIAETGNKRIIEVSSSGKIEAEIKLQVDKPHPHRDTRLVRKTAQGTYLVPHENDGVLREYDANSKVIWDYKIELVGPATPTHQGHGIHLYSAYRLPNGNTLIGGGNNNRVLEVNPQREIVWSIDRQELAGIKLFWVTQLHALPNGNVVITNTHAGGAYPQIIEVNRDKEIVWSMLDWETFGNDLCANQLLDVEGPIVR